MRAEIGKIFCGEMAERLNATVLKTVEAQVSEGSNPSLSFDKPKPQKMKAHREIRGALSFFVALR